MDNDDLKKLQKAYLTINESHKSSPTSYHIRGDDDELLESWIDVQNEHMALPGDAMPDTRSIAPLIYKSAKSLLTVDVQGVDPSTDGTENFYVIKDQRVLTAVARFFEASGDEFEVAESIQDGQVEFGVMIGVSGFTGEDADDMRVFLYESGAISKLKRFLNKHIK